LRGFLPRSLATPPASNLLCQSQIVEQEHYTSSSMHRTTRLQRRKRKRKTEYIRQPPQHSHTRIHTCIHTYTNITTRPSDCRYDTYIHIITHYDTYIHIITHTHTSRHTHTYGDTHIDTSSHTNTHQDTHIHMIPHAYTSSPSPTARKPPLAAKNIKKNQNKEKTSPSPTPCCAQTPRRRQEYI
jgi:hypothetical protein